MWTSSRSELFSEEFWGSDVRPTAPIFPTSKWTDTLLGPILRTLIFLADFNHKVCILQLSQIILNKLVKCGSGVYPSRAGAFNICDLLMPEAGVYVVPCFIWCNADTFKDGNGNTVTSVNTGPVALNVDSSEKSYTFARALVWVSKWEILGARYGAQIIPTLSGRIRDEVKM
ncbi:hypothetical protein [Petrachloros mirabilis]